MTVQWGREEKEETKLWVTLGAKKVNEREEAFNLIKREENCLQVARLVFFSASKLLERSHKANKQKRHAN